MTTRYLGIDLGAETIKVAELLQEGDRLQPGRTWCREHGKDPGLTLQDLLRELDWNKVQGAAVTGRLAGITSLQRLPAQAATAIGLNILHPGFGATTVVSIGSHGFSVTDIDGQGETCMRGNSRCSQGTGNFLRQLVERLDLDLPLADQLCEDAQAAPLSGRCPVILKTDLTHLANKGVDRARILAGLYDAVCQNVQALIRPTAPGNNMLFIGGVARAKRMQRRIREIAGEKGMHFQTGNPRQDRFLEAFGTAAFAAQKKLSPGQEEDLIIGQSEVLFAELPAFKSALSLVRRMKPCPAIGSDSTRVILGFDIGSTGSKVVAIDPTTRENCWEHYTDTLGNPIAAAQTLVREFLQAKTRQSQVVGIGVTGSGREIVGSILALCFGTDRVFVLNEIAAHAEGALTHDPEVDTIFEIGGQDAKYIRLDGGRICDAAMNEACSAGTGSFIEEQGKKFARIDTVVKMGKVAAGAESALSLGQHCSVFMAEVIDQAVAAGKPNDQILAGIYDSVIQNYLNRVKGSRSIGKKVFCQGMPFMSDALAAAVARRTGCQIIIPPNPGTVGAQGIALLAQKELKSLTGDELDLETFLVAKPKAKEEFTCTSTKGCGGNGNSCKIDRLRVDIGGREKKFLWGGSCSLYDRGGHKKKLPDLAPDPFREREALVDDLLQAMARNNGQPTRGKVAMADEFSLKSMLPFFATFIHELGFELQVLRGGKPKDLRQGIQMANVSYCAPMQMYHGLAARMLKDDVDFLFSPMLIELPRTGDEPHSSTCPIVQACPGLIKQALLKDVSHPKLLAPPIHMGKANFASTKFQDCCEKLAGDLGMRRDWTWAYTRAVKAQKNFNRQCREIGDRALNFAAKEDLPAVVVLGRGYTIYNAVLNSNVPTLLREQGAMAIPVDCYRLDATGRSFPGMFWHHGQINLRAAHQIRKTAAVYSVYCSNYACGPDSFNLHFYSYVMKNKPFALIETDGHSGDAGTRTRIEAFLFCVENDRRRQRENMAPHPANDFHRLDRMNQSLVTTLKRQDCLLIPPMGLGTNVCASAFRSEGFKVEALESTNGETLELGRKHTSGKECLPMILTTGTLLQRLAREEDPNQTFAFLMPTTCGPCRFGAYNLLHKIIMERVGWSERVRLVSPTDNNYFANLSADLTLRILVGMMGADLLEGALHDVRPVETRPGAAQEIYDRYNHEMHTLLSRPSKGSMRDGIYEANHGMFGIRQLIRRAAREFAACKDFQRDLPTIGMVGEIYMRLDASANHHLITRLEKMGVRVKLAPFSEWFEFTTWWREKRLFEGQTGADEGKVGAWFSSALQEQVTHRLYREMQRELEWDKRMEIHHSITNGEHYVNRALESETIITLGTALHDFSRGAIDGVVSVGPLECMPNKIAESHFLRADTEFGLPSLTLALNGESIEDGLLEDFIFQVKARLEKRSRQNRLAIPRSNRSVKEALWRTSGKVATRLIRMVQPRRKAAVNE